jgi:hypothetical protein
VSVGEARLRLGAAPGPIDRADVDIAVVTFFQEERPLRGAAGRADWRLCGAVSRLIQRGKLSGAWGEAALIPSTGGLRSRWVLVLGLGSRHELDEPRRRAIARVAVERALALGVGGSVALPLPPGGEGDSGVERRLDWVAEAMADVAAEAPGGLAVHVRLVPRSEEYPALVAALRRRARSEGPGGLHFDAPPEPVHPRAGIDEPAGGAPRPASASEALRVPVK